MIVCRPGACRRIHLRLDHVTDGEPARMQHAVMAKYFRLNFLRVVHMERAATRYELAAIADLAAGLRVEGRAVQYDDCRIAGLDGGHCGAAFVHRNDLTGKDQRVVTMKF